METILAVALAILLSRSLYGTRKKRVALEKIAELKYKRHTELQNKAKAISEQARGFTNTLGGEGAKMIAEIHVLIKEQEEIFSKLEYYLNSNKLEQATDLLVSFSLNQKAINSERLLSEISDRIAFASHREPESKPPKKRKRNSTIVSLRNAGLMEE